MPTVEVRPHVDTWVDQEAPTTSHGRAEQIRMRATTTSKGRYGFIFVGRPFPLGAVVTSATLTLTAASTWSSPNLTVKRVTGGWKERGATWNNAPSTTATSSVLVVPVLTAGQSYAINVTAMMQDVAAGGAWHGFRLEKSGDSVASFYSSNNVQWARRPVLEVEYGVVPAAPENLSPAGGGAVSINFPTFTWEFGERWGDNAEQTASEMEISSSAALDPDGTFTTPLSLGSDAGKKANVDQQYNPSAGWAGISAGATRYWHVRAWDEDDNPSGWSDVADFTRVAKPTVTITNPSGATVADTTPPIVWSVSGATQRSREVKLWRLFSGGGRKLMYHWPREVTTGLDVRVPMHPTAWDVWQDKGVIWSGPTFEVRVRVWDTTDRVRTPGDPPYGQASRQFTYARDGTPAQVLTLNAVQNGAAVNLTWTRTATPDYFSLKVDGVEASHRISSSTTSTGGTNYAMTWWGARPGVAHLYEMEAVVRTGVAPNDLLLVSDNNATKTLTTNVTGIYLADPDDDTFVRLRGPSEVSMGIREVGETFEILGQRRPVRITDDVGGYVGSVSGVLFGKAERDKFLDLKGRLKRLRLIVGDLNIPVFLEGVEDVAPIGETPNQSEMFSCSFGCFQVSDFDDTFEVVG